MRHDTSTTQDREFGEELAKAIPNAEWVLNWIESTFSVNEVFNDDEIKKYVKDNMNPEDVFDDSELNQWAEENGFIKKGLNAMAAAKVPTEPGFYWADYNDHRTIARVYGDFPFLRIDIFNIRDKDYKDDVNPTYVTKWGDKIPDPK